MNFHHRRSEEPDINLIPFIDVLLVVLIFLMLTTTYSKYTELKITLPTAAAEQMKDRPKEILVVIAGDGRISIDRRPVDSPNVARLAAELTAAAQGQLDRTVIISADASTPHQSVINAMDAARRAGLSQLTFAAQRGAGDAAQ
jgi:biopolymer transport protein ExbD